MFLARCCSAGRDALKISLSVQFYAELLLLTGARFLRSSRSVVGHQTQGGKWSISYRHRAALVPSMTKCGHAYSASRLDWRLRRL